MRGLFFDLETTSLDTNKARIIQGAFSVFDLETKQELYHYSQLSWDSTYPYLERVTTLLTGITQNQLIEFGDKPTLFLEKLLFHARGCEFMVSHNGFNYDIPVLTEELKRYELDELTSIKHTDTRFDLPYPEHITTRKLTYLAAEHGFTNFKAHGARFDVDCMARLFFMYPTLPLLERAKYPMIWIRADVIYEKKDLAKELKYNWDPANKMWVKPIREIDLPVEKDLAQDKFRVLILEHYRGNKNE